MTLRLMVSQCTSQGKAIWTARPAEALTAGVGRDMAGCGENASR